jgi:hypothetical protein
MAEQHRLDAQRELEVLDAERLSAEGAAERPRDGRVAGERGDRSLAVAPRAAALDELHVKRRMVAERFEAVAGERLEAAVGVVEAGAEQRYTGRGRTLIWRHRDGA